MIQRLEPRFNRQSKSWRRYTYLKLTAERFPRLVVTRVMRADGSYYLGPFRSTAAAHSAREAIEDAVPLRRCGLRIGKSAALSAGPPCVPAQLGVATCPCRAQVTEDEYRAIAETTRHALRHEALLYAARSAMRRLAETERFEEAALTRSPRSLTRDQPAPGGGCDPSVAGSSSKVPKGVSRSHGCVVPDDDDRAEVEPPTWSSPDARADELPSAAGSSRQRGSRQDPWRRSAGG
jgi:hypothetical protein